MPQWQLKHRSGEVFPANFKIMDITDARSLPQLGWEKTFDWSKYIGPNNPATPYKLLVVGDNYIQGAIAYQIREDSVFVELLESGPANRYMDPNREFINVTDILLGKACMESFYQNKDGFVSFIPKTKLEPYYARRFGAKRGGLGMMYLDNVAAIRLIRLYYL